MSLIDPVVLSAPRGDDPPTATLYYGQDCRESLRQLPDQSVHCVATSPPYWALRRYPNGESVIRQDLTAEERLFVLAELEKLGIQPIATLLG
jgi:hypothetical protein